MRRTRAKKVAVALAVSMAVVVVAASDKRRWPSKHSRRFSVRSEVWLRVLRDPAYAEGWFPTNLRCNRTTFLAIVARVEARWSLVRRAPRPNAFFGIRERVAIALYYMTHATGAYSAGQIVGACKSQSLTYIRQVVQVVASFTDESIRRPKISAEWASEFAGFEKLHGFPRVAGAIDGTLIRIKRLEDFEGFYCRKGFPAFNVLAAVNHKEQFTAFSIRNGAQNDQSVLNRSHFGQTIAVGLPEGAYYLGDAGYKLTSHILTPYPIEYGMSLRRSRYNYIHSHTRIIVEQAFGRLKGIFRMYKQPLLQSTPEYMARIITATLVLHNWLIDLSDKTHKKKRVIHVEDEITPENDEPAGILQREAIADKLYREYLAHRA